MDPRRAERAVCASRLRQSRHPPRRPRLPPCQDGVTLGAITLLLWAAKRQGAGGGRRRRERMRPSRAARRTHGLIAGKSNPCRPRNRTDRSHVGAYTDIEFSLSNLRMNLRQGRRRRERSRPRLRLFLITHDGHGRGVTPPVAAGAAEALPPASLGVGLCALGVGTVLPQKGEKAEAFWNWTRLRCIRYLLGSKLVAAPSEYHRRN